MADQKLVREGDRVIFKTDDKTKVFQVSKNRSIFFEKSKLRGEEIVGQKYGTLFEVQQGKLVVVTETSASGSATSSAGAGKDNRDLVASEENQKLSQDDILKMKAEGLSGKDIVGKLVEQSETFKTKTEFSQEKYIKKKKKKHMLVFRILHPNSCLLLDTFKHNPSKICNLRADSLSQLLCYSNVMGGSTVGVVESCHGLVLGSVMERMGGKGKVLHLFPGNDMNRHVVKDFNFSEEQTKMLLEFPLNKLASLENGTLFATTDPDPASKDNTPTSTSPESKDHPAPPPADQINQSGKDTSADLINQSTKDSSDPGTESKDAVMDVDADGGNDDNGDACGDKAVPSDDSEDGGNSGCEGKQARKARGKRKSENTRISREEQEARRQHRAEKVREAALVLEERNLDSLIIATKYDPVQVLMRLLPFVALSRPVVVFCQHKEPLVECFKQVKENGSGIQLKLSESWYREYQVLPSRTHALMSMSGTGGYLLSFIRVASHQ